MMRYFLIVLSFIFFLMSACQNNDTEQAQAESSAATGHKVTVVEVQQANQYTYLKVKENDEEYWMAVTKMNAEEGKTYYYDGRMEMNNFKSKDLDRTFEKIYFVQRISSQPLMSQSRMGQGQMSSGRPSVAKQEVKIDQPPGGTTIADIFEKRTDLAGKNIKVRGKITKVNNGIMGRNWIHIQDGTSSQDKYDLTLTTNESFKVGEVVTVEGTVAINKDFGAGYSYDLLIEEAKKVNPEKM